MIAQFSIRAGKMKNGFHSGGRPGGPARATSAIGRHCSDPLKRPLSSAKQPVPAEGGGPLINSHVALGTGGCVAL